MWMVSSSKDLDSSRVANEGCRHLEASGRDVAHRSLDVVGDPFHKVGAVLVLNSQHLFIHFLSSDSEIPSARCANYRVFI